MSWVTDGTGSFFLGAAKVDAAPSALPAQNKLVADEVNEIRDALFALRSQFMTLLENPVLNTPPATSLRINSDNRMEFMMTPAAVGTRIQLNFRQILDDLSENGAGHVGVQVVNATDTASATSIPSIEWIRSGTYIDSTCGIAPYDIGTYYAGMPPTSGTILSHLCVRDSYLMQSFGKCRAYAGVSGSQGFEIRLNGTKIGEMIFTNSDTATFSDTGYSTDIQLTEGSLLTVVATGSQSQTLADITLTLFGYFSGIAIPIAGA